jgi:hypothetical protein
MWHLDAVHRRAGAALGHRRTETCGFPLKRLQALAGGAVRRFRGDLEATGRTVHTLPPCKMRAEYLRPRRPMICMKSVARAHTPARFHDAAAAGRVHRAGTAQGSCAWRGRKSVPRRRRQPRQLPRLSSRLRVPRLAVPAPALPPMTSSSFSHDLCRGWARSTPWETTPGDDETS